MKKTNLISFALLFLLTGQAAADMPWWLGDVQIVPQNPSSSDIVSMTLSGQWSDSCIPNDSDISATDGNVYFDAIRNYPSVYCLPFCCPAWELTESVGPLSAGTYTVYARLIEIVDFSPPEPGPYEPVAEFTVAPSTYYVDAADGNDTTGDGSEENPFATIQKGIDDANNGDTVIVADGTYTGDGNRDLDFGGKAITVRSENGREVTIIDCNGSELQPHRGFYFHTGEDTNSVVDGFTIQNGNASGELISGYGGGMLNIDTSPTVRNCIFRDNYAIYGGAISNWFDYAEPTVTNCIFKDNEASEYGGAIDNTWASPGISDCLFVGNQANRGGAISSHEFFSDPTITNTIFCGNSAALYGGAMYYDYCSATVTNCTFSNNAADYGNSVCNTFAADPKYTNCIMWNDSEGGDEVYNDLAWPSIAYCDVRGGYPGLGNINADPCFADPCNGDCHLQSAAGRWDPNSESWVIDSNTSLCIDAGNPGCLPGEEPDPNGNRINMGAYGGTAEASKSPESWALLADLTNDHKVDSDDLRVFVDYWLEEGQCVPSDLDRSQLVDFIDYAIFALQCSEPPTAEPGMTYQIGDCDSLAASSDSNEPRFSAWVEGRYIHFEDLMYANCCPDELGLEKEINGNQITLYEIGYGGMCLCMCYFPITATLGPFEDGTYTIEVFDNYGQSLGIVEVTIGESAEPGISYQIDDCNQEVPAFLASEQSGQTRFTVTVEGQYIHFEDMMVANCCPDELVLEMTVQDNLITILEIEYTSSPCRCICDFPVTATLGPFEPGTYTLEVYEDYGGFLGSTTVTISPDQ